MILEEGRCIEYGQREELANNSDSRFAQLLQIGRVTRFVFNEHGEYWHSCLAASGGSSAADRRYELTAPNDKESTHRKRVTNWT